MKLSLISIASSALLVLVSGCSSNPKAAFTDVSNVVAERTGQKVMWPRNEGEDEEVRKAKASLLEGDLSPEKAVQIALFGNPHLQGVFEEVGIAKADLVQAGLLRNPRFAASFRFPKGTPAGLNSEYSLVGDILDLIILPLRKRIAAQNLEAVKLRVADEVLKTAAEVKGAFYAVQAREQLIKRIRFIVEVNESSADVAKRMRDAGNIPELEFADQQAIYAQSRVALGESLRDLRSDRERFNRLLGLWGNEIGWKVADELPAIPQKEISLENLETVAITQRLDLAALRAQLTNAISALKLQNGTRFFPGAVEVGIDTEKEPDGQRVTGPTLELELPIFDQGQAAIAKLKSQFRQAEREFEARAIEIRSEVRENRDRLIANRELAEYYEKILLPLRVKIVNQSLLHYNAMQIGPVELLLAKERELDAERAYVDAWRDYWISRAELERAVGGTLSASEASSVNEGSSKAHSEHSAKH